MDNLSPCTKYNFAVAAVLDGDAETEKSVSQEVTSPLDENEDFEAPNLVIHNEDRDELYKNRSSRIIDPRRLISREYDFLKTFSLTENQFSGKTYFYTIAFRAFFRRHVPQDGDSLYRFAVDIILASRLSY